MPELLRNAFGLGLLVLTCCGVVRNAEAQGFPLSEAPRRMTTAGGLQVHLFAGEPLVRQPILVKCDDRGRLWTIQYLQYPNPAGLKRVRVDRWSRTTYDRIPAPPPRGPRGADRVTILEDTDGDGRADRSRDFLDGLNLATGLAFGHGGVYVIQVPYLLFYPDRDRDDVPDTAPRVVLKGFGMQDAQSLANHLTWGPDGWLYGLNGSTTTCRIRGIEFQQGCWRYHPPTDRFELFCEGGGNLFGLTFDDSGRLFYSSNGGLFYHAVQGGYFAKSFAKHGPLHHLYTYGHFQAVHRGSLRGGPTTGGIIYQGNSFPPRFHGRFLCGNFLGQTCSWWDVRPSGSSVTASFKNILLNSHDSWFGPTDLCNGPGGAVYISDFHDRRTAHPDPDAKWDRSNGRIYRLSAGAASPEKIDIGRLTSQQLVDLLSHPNGWFADRARIEMAARRDSAIVPRLKTLAQQHENRRLALQALWALHATSGLDETLAGTLLRHPAPFVRSWTVRLLGDRRKVPGQIGQRLARLAVKETHPVVLVQLAASARRLPATDSLPIIRTLLERQQLVSDPRLPLMTWWALEQHALSSTSDVLELFLKHSNAWRTSTGLACGRNLIRRFAAEGNSKGYKACSALLAALPASQRMAGQRALSQGLAERADGLSGVGHGGLFNQFGTAAESSLKKAKRRYEPLSGHLKEYVEDHWNQNRNDTFWSDLAVRCRITDSHPHARQMIADLDGPVDNRSRWLRLLRQYGGKEVLPLGVRYIGKQHPVALRSAALEVVGRFGDLDSLLTLAGDYPQLPARLQPRARSILLARGETAQRLLEHVDQGKVPAKTITVTELRPVASLDNPTLANLIKKHWGSLTPGTPEEKLATMRRFNNDLRVGGGNRSRGRELFKKHCQACHRLFNEGSRVGPDLTSTSRKDTHALLANIVDPSAVIRRDFLSSIIVTNNGRTITGLVTDRKGDTLSLVDARGKPLQVAKVDIERIRISEVSVMPEKLLEQLTPQQLRDLFSYLQGSAP